MNIISDVINLYIDRFDFFLELLIQHIFLCFIAIFFITIIGIPIGIYIAKNKRISNIVLGIANFIYTIPSIALFGFLVVLTGVGNTSAVIALVLYGIMPIIKSTYAGINNVDPLIVESAVAMGSSKKQLFLNVEFPLALPVIFSGFRTMVVMTIALGGIASFIGAGGLGVAIWRGISTNNSPLILAGSLLVALLAIIIDYMLGKIDTKINNKMLGIRESKKINKKFLILIFSLIFILFSYKIIDRIFINNDTIVVATKPGTEQYILGEIISQLIEEHTDLTVSRKFSIGGGSSNIHPAMLRGDIDIFPEYTGTAWLFILGEDPIYEEDLLHEKVKQMYLEKFNIKWFEPYGFNNTFTLAMKNDVALEYNIETFSDLALISNNFSFGAEHDFFEREDGYIGLVERYNFNFYNTVSMDMGLKYRAISSNNVDVINAFSTDALLKHYNLRVLEDDQQFFIPYQAATLVRMEILEEHVELEDLLRKLENTITDEDMLYLNYQVDVLNKDIRDVARDFLISRDLI